MNSNTNTNTNNDERPTKRARVQRTHWVFTSFQPASAIREALQAAVASGRVIYCIGQCESAPTTGRDHVQGYLELKRSQDIRTVQRLLGDDGAHLEARKGTRGEAREYCRKEETRVPGTEPFEYGTWREETKTGGSSGSRTDLHGVADAILSQEASYQEVAVSFPSEFIKFHRGIRELIGVRDTMSNAGSNREVSVQIFVGPPGYGKTRRALCENPDAFVLDTQNKGDTIWWDGYAGQQCVIIDEFNGQIPYRYLLQLLDRYPALKRLPIKGGFVPALFTKVVVTSNKPPNKWYNEEKVGKYEDGPLERRVEEGEYVFFFEPWVPQETGIGEISSE